MTEVGKISIPVDVTGASAAERELAKASRAYDKHTGSIKENERSLAGARGVLGDTASAFRNGTAEAIRHGSALRGAGRDMRAWGTETAGAGAMGVLAFGLAINKGVAFGKQMSAVKAATGAQGDEFRKLRDAAIDWGAKSQFNATEVAAAMTEMGKAGFDSAQTLDALPGVLDAAAASGEDMANVTGILVDTLGPFKMGAEAATHVSDALAYAANATTSSIGDMGEAMKYVAPVALKAGSSFDEINAALLVLAKNGIKGSMAGTNLRGMLTDMQAPSVLASKKMKEVGLSFRDAEGRMLPFAKNIDRLKVALGKMNAEEADKFLRDLFGVQQISAARAFLETGGEGLRNFTEKSREADGAAKEFAATLRDNLGGDAEQLAGKLESAAITVTDDLTPALRSIIGTVGGVVDGFLEMDSGIRKVIVASAALGTTALVGLGAFGVAAGAVMSGVGALVTVAGTAIAGVTALGTALGTLTFAASGSSTAIATMGLAMAANPLLTGVIAIGAIGAAAVAIATMGDNSDDMRMSAEQAAAAVSKLNDASRELAGTNLTQKEADLQAVIATKELSAARKHLRDVQKSGKASAEELEAAQLAVAQAELRAERASQGAAKAREDNSKTIKAMRTALETNRQVLQEEAAIQETARAGIKRWSDAVKDGSVDAATGNREITRFSRALADSQERAGAAQKAIDKAAGRFRELGPAAKGSADDVRELGNLLAGLPKDVKINVRVMTQQINNRPAGAGTYAPPVPNYGGGGKAQGKSLRGFSKGTPTASAFMRSSGPKPSTIAGGSLQGDSFMQGGYGSQTYLGAIAADPTFEGLIYGAGQDMNPSAETLQGTVAAAQRRSKLLMDQRRKLIAKQIPAAQARVKKAKANVKAAKAKVTAAAKALRKARGKAAIDKAKKALEKAQTAHGKTVDALDNANDALQRLTGKRDEIGQDLLGLADEALAAEQALEEATATRDAEGNITAYGEGAIAGIQSDPAGLQAGQDAAAAAAYAAEDLRREALGLPSQQEEAHLADLNRIRAANGLPPLAPGETATSANSTAGGGSSSTTQPYVPGQNYAIGVGWDQAGQTVAVSGLVIHAGSYQQGQDAAAGFLEALASTRNAQTFQSNSVVVR